LITNFINGAVPGIIATSFSYPLDMMKTRKLTTHRNNSFRQIYDSIGYENGEFRIRNFWKGISSTHAKVCIYGGFGMIIYENVRSFFNSFYL
jgi:hypothetical protein